MKPFLALTAALAFAVLAVSQLHPGKRCDSQCETGASAGAKPAAGFCRLACATKVQFQEADVLPQPGAVVGRLTRCPVSDVVFAVQRGRRMVSHEGQDYYLCCGGCERVFRQDPARFVKA
jgi:YHS domain-containing protein